MIDQAKVQSLFKPQFINEVFQKMCEASFALKHGTRLPNMTGKTMDMDILSNLPMAYWVGQDTKKRKTTSLALKGKRFYVKELSIIVTISRNSLQDAFVDLEKIIKERLVEADATKIIIRFKIRNKKMRKQKFSHFLSLIHYIRFYCDTAIIICIYL